MISQTVNGLERRLVFKPGFHKVNADPKKDYGVHGMEMWFYIIGPKGAVHFGLYTGFMLNKTIEWWKETGRGTGTLGLFPMGVDVGYHSPTPRYEGAEVAWPTKRVEKKKSIVYDKDNPTEFLNNIEFVKFGDKPPICEFIGVPCYSDGSALRADKWKDIFVSQGDEAIWKMMEEEYYDLFDSKK